LVFFSYLVANGKLQELWKLLEPSFFLALMVFFALAALLISYYEYHGIGPQDGIVRRGPHENIVSLTFDDGPNPVYTPQILDILKEKGVKASFFVVGENVNKYPEIARRIVSEGHDIGNHTYSHRELVPSTKKLVLNQLEKTDFAIRKAIGVKTRLFRPPRGIYSNAVRELVVTKGYRIILWTVSSADWSGVSPKTIFRRIRWYTRNGGIILFHDSGALIRKEGASRGNTVQALPMIIDYLRERRGFGIIPISEMLDRLGEEELIESEEAFEKI
jgi:peptidoglycan/xylan/chitin deacetylase (PgdA/CDA1 family)